MGKYITSLLVIILMLLTNCGTSSNEKKESTTEKVKNLIVGLSSQPKTIDPRFSTDATGMRMSHHLIFSTLVYLNDNLKITPSLAVSWENPNNKTYIFTLQKGVTFHDGKPLTAHDVKFTFEHLKNPETKSPFAGTYKDVESIEVINDHTVKFVLVQPVASFLTSLIMPIVPKHLVESGDTFPKTLIGSGPFKFVNQSEQEIKLVKNDAYFGGAPKLDSIIFKVVKDDNTRFLKMKKGELDIVINGMASNKIDDFKKAPLSETYSVMEAPGISYNYLAFNMQDKMLSNKNLRKAIAHALNIDEIIQYRLDGHAGRSTGLLSSVNWFAEPNVATYDHNIAKAKEYLTKAGYKDPDGDGPKTAVTLEMKTSSNKQVVGIAQIMKSQLAKAGIDLQVKSFEWATFYGDIKKGNFQMTSMRWVGVTEPDFYYNIFHSKQTPPAGRNRGLFKNSKIDELTEKGRVELDDNKRKGIYSEIQKIAAEELPYVSLWHANNVSIVNKRVVGYTQHPMGAFLPFITADIK